MKIVSILILVSLFVFTGCQDDNSILEPNKDYANYEMSKGRPILSTGDDALKFTDDSDISDIIVDDINYKYSQSFVVDGSKGGRVSVKYSWKDGRGYPVSLTADLVIPKGAYKGSLEFDMIFDLENYAMELYPSPFTFDKPVDFSMYFYGVDLSQFAGSDIDFNYLDSEGETIESKFIHFDVKTGTLQVWNAQLHHFSRYGWTRTTTTK
jgi:hypothetical protein